MRMIARDVAMGLYELEDILKTNDVTPLDFEMIRNHPRFIDYLRQEQEAWKAAGNVTERTKLKAGIIIEEWLVNSYAELNDKKTPLNQRVELAKLLAKMAGIGEPKAGAGSGNGFQLTINIGPGVAPVTINTRQIIDHDNDELYSPPQEI